MVGFGADFVDRVVAGKFESMKKVGRGLYGIVWKAKPIGGVNDRPVAIKRMFNAFSNRIDAKRTYRELSYLLKFCTHPNIVSVHEIIASEDDMDIYVVMEHLDVDLGYIIQSMLTLYYKTHTLVAKLQQIHVEFITWQLFAALKYIHSAGIVHRDVKPQNILLNSKCGVRLCDFGMARSVVARDPDPYTPLPADFHAPSTPVVRLTNYCSSRWYRSPEQLVNARNYSTAIDVWAAGCVVGEMIQRKPVFPGSCTYMQLSLIVHLTGTPADVDLAGINSKYVYSILESLGNSKQGKIVEIVPNASREAADFMHLCFQFNPDKRMTAVEALEHPFLTHFHHPDAEPSHPSAISGGISLPLNDDVQFSVSTYRDQLYADILGNKRLQAQIYRDRLIRENLLRGTDPKRAATLGEYKGSAMFPPRTQTLHN